MKLNLEKLEEIVLALLGACEFENGRVWKRIDFGIMDALHEKGLITQPRGKAESVYLTESGYTRAKKLAEEYQLIVPSSPSTEDKKPVQKSKRKKPKSET